MTRMAATARIKIDADGVVIIIADVEDGIFFQSIDLI